MTKHLPDRNGKSRLLPTLAGLFFLAWTVAVFFAVRDTFFTDRQGKEPVADGTILSLPDGGKGRFPILDRGGRELAVSFPAKSVYARPLEVEHPDAVALFLARELGLSERELRRNLKEERSFVWLGRHVSEAAVGNIRARNLRGIYVVDESQRFYPQGSLAAQLLGVAREGQGLTGIEARYDQHLQAAADLAVENGQPRGPLLLTLDLRIQELLERELGQLAGETGATGGEGIVIDPRSGEVLALANLPAFEANFFGDSDENSRLNRALSRALPASGFGQLFRLAASSQPVQIEIPAPVVVQPAKRDRLAALKKELRKGSRVVGTFGGGANRLVPFEGGYRSPGLAGLMKLSEPPGWSSFMAGLGFGQKLVLELPVGTVSKAFTGEKAPPFEATGGEMVAALARLLDPNGTVVPQVVAGVAEPNSGRVQPLPKPDSPGVVEAEAVQRLRDYLNRLAPDGGPVILEELTELLPPVTAESPADEGAEGGGREPGQVWEPGQPPIPGPGQGRAEGPATVGRPVAPLPEKSAAGGAESAKVAAVEGPKHYISLLVSLPGGDGAGVLLLLALEGAVLDPASPSPLRLAAERILPQIRIWAAENLGPPAAISWAPNEALWQAQWQKAQAGRGELRNLVSRSNRRLMPDLQGVSLRKALQVMTPYGLKVRVQGVGRVVEQRPGAGEPITVDECLLVLSGLNLIDVQPDRELAVGMESESGKLKIFSSVTNPRPVVGGGD